MTDDILESGLTGLEAIASTNGQPRLLVSVRNADEAAAALAGGADVIDVKEPANGPLGAATNTTICSVIDRMAGEAPVTAACGELEDFRAEKLPPHGLAAMKFGLAGSAAKGWRSRLDIVRRLLHKSVQLVPAAYADHLAAGSPSASEILDYASDRGLEWIVLDTWEKSNGSVFNALTAVDLSLLLERAKVSGVRIVLAGSIAIGQLAHVGELGPAVVGVRGAVCRGGRSGMLCVDLVARFRRELDACCSTP